MWIACYGRRVSCRHGQNMTTRGRTSKINDPDTTRRLLEALELGLDYRTAAEYAGVGARTERIWRERGLAALESGSRRKGDRPYIAYYEATLAARGKGQFDTAKLIQQAGHVGFKAVTTRIEQLTMNGAVVSEKVVTEERDVPPDWRAALAAGTYRFGWTKRDELSGPAGEPLDGGMTVDKWRKLAGERRQQAAETMAMFTDEAGDAVED